MVAKITTPASLQETLNYNEHKVRRGVATCIAENHFPFPVHAMNFYQKLHWFEQRNELNTRATTKTIHISLNFSPSESLTNESLIEIANDYMMRIGFVNQPYLVYRHHDAGHPHVHILATTIREDGSRINTHNIGRNQSEIARKAIEEKYNLVRAENRKQLDETMHDKIAARKMVYGKSETKRGIANALKQVLSLYNYTSLAELNAVLKEFGVMADRGNKHSFTFRKNGLLYRVLDGDGIPTGVPIKASTIAGKPTLAYLEKRFEQNKKDREIPKLSLQNALDKIIQQNLSTIDAFKQMLAKENIVVVLRQNAEGRIYGITFVDHRNRSVFNGSELGKEYSIAGIYKQLAQSTSNMQQHTAIHQHSISHTLFDELLRTENDNTHTPNQLIKKKKKKKRKL
ncbi:MAG: relaxase/mobilization nuclease domain-containing protein [Bacteroidota bacterium]